MTTAEILKTPEFQEIQEMIRRFLDQYGNDLSEPDLKRKMTEIASASNNGGAHDEAGWNGFKEEWQRNRDFFETNKKRLSKEYPNEYVAILERSVLDHGNDVGELASRIYDRYGNVPVFAGYTGEQEPVIIDTPIC